jgi:hypothetical protein
MKTKKIKYIKLPETEGELREKARGNVIFFVEYGHKYWFPFRKMFAYGCKVKSKVFDFYL